MQWVINNTLYGDLANAMIMLKISSWDGTCIQQAAIHQQ